MLPRNGVVRPGNRPLQLAPEPFNRIRMHITSNVLFQSVFHRLAHIAEPLRFLIDPELISHKVSRGLYVLADGIENEVRFPRRQCMSAYSSLSFDHAEQSRLVGHFHAHAATSSYISFVYFNSTIKQTAPLFHKRTNLESNAPRAFVRYAQLPLQFLRGHAVLGRREQEDSVEPFGKRSIRLFKDSSGQRVNLRSVLVGIRLSTSYSVVPLRMGELIAKYILKAHIVVRELALEVRNAVLSGFFIHTSSVANGLLAVKG